MVTLFRRIRQKLIDSGSVSKYLLYALGEILLVVVGILIALQVNNWNEQRLLENSAQSHVRVLGNNLNEDLAQLTEIHINLMETLRSSQSMMNRFQVNKAPGDSIYYEMLQILFEFSFEPNDDGVNILINSGELGVLSDTLQAQISRYYNTVEGIQERDEISNTFIKNQYEDYIFEYYHVIFGVSNPHPVNQRFFEDETREPEPNNFEDLLSDKRLEALIIGRLFQTERQLEFYNQGIEEINRLIEMINER